MPRVDNTPRRVRHVPRGSWQLFARDLAGALPKYQDNPGPDVVIERGSVLIVLAEAVEMNRLRTEISNGDIGRLT